MSGFQYIEATLITRPPRPPGCTRLQYFPTAEGYVENTAGFCSTEVYSYVYNHTDHLGNIRLSYKDTDNNGTISSNEILEENNYYPFGLKHKGYNGNNAQPNYKYKYNGKELQDELGLNMYDLGARMYMADIGRFAVVDPMTDFVNYQSPYVISDNNPVLNVDEYGLGILNVIGNLFKRLVGAVGSIGNDCSCNKYTQESVGQAWRRADFPVLNEKIASLGDKISSLFSSSNKPTPASAGGEGKTPVVGVASLDPVGIKINDNINIQVPEINIPTPRNLSRENNNGVLPTGTKIDINVRFKASSAVIDADLSSDVLNSLLKTLVDYPQILLLIQGNVSNSGAPNMDKNTVIKIDNGQGKVGELQLLRAKAIKRFLVKNGIDPTRLSVGQGSIGPNTASATGESR